MKKPPPPSTNLPQTWWQWVLVYPGLVLGLLGSVPTVIEALKSWRFEVPFGTVAVAERSAAMFVKNESCLARIATGDHVVTLPDKTAIVATPCDSGDILIRVDPPDGHSILHFIARETFLKSAAAALPMQAAAATIAQAGRQQVAVLCILRPPRGPIIRRVRLANGECIDELINRYTGVVTSVRPAGCTC